MNEGVIYLPSTDAVQR